MFTKTLALHLLLLLAATLVACSLGSSEHMDIASVISSSYTSLMSSQCKARCLALYPWRIISPAVNSSNIAQNERHHRAMRPTHAHKVSRMQRLSNNTLTAAGAPIDSTAHLNVKWHKVMELCSKNPNCLQVLLPLLLRLLIAPLTSRCSQVFFSQQNKQSEAFFLFLTTHLTTSTLNLSVI